MAMTKEHREILRANHLTIVENLILSEEFMSVLLSDGVLTSSMKEMVQAKKTRTERVREFVMSTLPRRGDQAFKIFIQALVESRQDHLAKCLDPSLAAEYMEERDQAEQERPRPAQVEAQGNFAVSWQPGPEVDETDDAWYKMLFDESNKDLGVVMKQMGRERQERVQEMVNSRKAYPLKKKGDVFGRAVIIDNIEYTFQSPRIGSSFDCEHLEKLFQQLHFKTVTHKDLTGEEMLNTLMDEKNNKEHGEYSSFVLCILAHGLENKVYGIDGIENHGAIGINKITSLFSSVECPGLAGKPKLFFIQACQGGKDMVAVALKKVGVSSHPDTSHDLRSDVGSQAKAVRVNHSQPQSDARPAAAIQQPMKEESDAHPLPTPEVADVLVACSTAPGYKSWRNAEFGSWFIRCLVYVIVNNACEDHILDMLTEVARIISHFKYEKSGSYAVQIPQIVSTLRRKVFFMP